jgi:hypothetical protein
MNGVPVQPAPLDGVVLLLALNKMPHLSALLFIIMGQLIRKRLSATKSTFRRIYQSIKV